LAIALAMELPSAAVVATDISPRALAVAARNAERHNVLDRIELRESDLFHMVPECFNLIVSNPPYVARNDPALAPDVAEFEPSLALLDNFEGDGLGYYRRIAGNVRDCLADEGTVLVEVGEGQAGVVCAWFESEDLSTSRYRDLAGIERVVEARASSGA